MAAAKEVHRYPVMEEEQLSSSSSSGRPKPFSYQSNSLPSTPRQHARDAPYRSRTPSPSKRRASQSPISLPSAARHPYRPTGPIAADCRFKTTQTSRRRMDYSSDELLGPAPEGLKTALSPAESDRLAKEIDELYRHLLPSQPGQLRREKVLAKLRSIIAKGLPEKKFDVHVFGSSGNLLFTDKSDGTMVFQARKESN